MAPKNTKSQNSPSQQQAPSASSSAAFQIPKASPIANYEDNKLTDRQKFLLTKMEKMSLYKPKHLPPPQLKRNRGWFKILLEKYNIETALYMLEPWERFLLNSLLFLFALLMMYWASWLWRTGTQASVVDYFVSLTTGGLMDLVNKNKK